MTGQHDLEKLLASMEPKLQPEEYVFCTLPIEEAEKVEVHPISTFIESEGVTLILRKQEATNAGLEFIYPCRMITLNIHSSLEAVGFLAAITTKLAKAGISVNPVSAYYHDHLFVPSNKVEMTMKLLAEFSS
ncbi:MAG: ACT domain-containing protein [Symploca sp. SIO2E9]|nr:ACT domain-containing protein [Symploca sp. SIO2E9]